MLPDRCPTVALLWDPVTATAEPHGRYHPSTDTLVGSIRIIPHGGSGALVDSRSNDGATALTVASSPGHVYIIKCLILHTSATFEAHTDDGRTPLILASGRGYTDIVYLLLQWCDHRLPWLLQLLLVSHHILRDGRAIS